MVDLLFNVLVWNWKCLPKDGVPFKVFAVLWLRRELGIVWKKEGGSPLQTDYLGRLEDGIITLKDANDLQNVIILEERLQDTLVV